VLALIAAYWVVHRTPPPPKPPSAAVLARHGCTLRQFPSAGRTHVSGSKPPSAYRVEYVAPSRLGKNPDGTTVKYDSFPPTSGPHYPQWVTWGSYAKPLPEIAAVHNLEHGGVIVQYGSRVPAATVAALRAFVAASPNGMLMAPLAQLRSTIALTAWTYRAMCTRFDRTAFTLFRDTFRFKGPERFPASALAPGD
jgi:hypothetical protein